MAKNKSSTALFDVIHAAKKPPKSSPSASIAAPRWWGKDKKPVKPAVAEATENVGKQRSWLLAAKQGLTGTAAAAPSLPASDTIAQVDAPVSDPAMVTESNSIPAEARSDDSRDADVQRAQYAEIPTEEIPAEAPAPKVRFIDRFKKASAVEVPALQASSCDVADDDAPLPVFYSTSGDVKSPTVAAEPSRPPREQMVAFDRARGDIRFSLSYGGAAAIGFIFCIAMAIAFIAGTHTQTSAIDSDSTDARDVASKPAQPTAPNSALSMAVGSGRSTSDNPHTAPDVLQLDRRVHPPTDSQSAPSAPLPIKATRDIGMMYMVIQSYPEPDLAQKACDFVNRAGVPCTLVKGLAGYTLGDWYTVVGLKPYRKHDPALEEDERAITLLGKKFSNKIYNQFQPAAYTWRPESDAGQ